MQILIENDFYTVLFLTIHFPKDQAGIYLVLAVFLQNLNDTFYRMINEAGICVPGNYLQNVVHQGISHLKITIVDNTILVTFDLVFRVEVMSY